MIRLEPHKSVFKVIQHIFVSKCITLSCVKASLRSYIGDIYEILGIDTVIIGLLIPKGGVFDDLIRIVQLIMYYYSSILRA